MAMPVCNCMHHVMRLCLGAGNASHMPRQKLKHFLCLMHVNIDGCFLCVMQAMHLCVKAVPPCNALVFGSWQSVACAAVQHEAIHLLGPSASIDACVQSVLTLQCIYTY